MTTAEKKAFLEECLRKVDKMPKTAGSVTLHISPDKKVKSIEVKDIE